ncbi:MAG: hypothetical protein WCG27_08780, partial [Pseudomonadota bacterium]
MINKILFLWAIFHLGACLALESPFLSTVPGIDIKNTHKVDKNGRVLRGMAPGDNIQQLVDYGITDVLMFKNPLVQKTLLRKSKSDNQLETERLLQKGFKEGNVHQIPFRWKEISSQ